LRLHNIDVRNSCRISGSVQVSLTSRTTLKAVAGARTSNRHVVLGPDTSATMLLTTQASPTNLPAGQRCTEPGLLSITLPGTAAHRTDGETGDQNIASCGGLTLSELTLAK
jgi:hypothetical protein